MPFYKMTVTVYVVAPDPEVARDNVSYILGDKKNSWVAESEPVLVEDRNPSLADTNDKTAE